MTRSHRRPQVWPHLYRDNPHAAGTCAVCGLADPKSHNRVHQPANVEVDAATAEHRRRVGDRL